MTEALAALEVDEGKSELDDLEALVEAGFVFGVADLDLLEVDRDAFEDVEEQF